MYDIYSCADNDSVRFALGKNGERKLFVLGLNPSTANKEKSDTTVAKVKQVAVKNRFSGFVMLNLYPLRSTNPDGLPQNEDLQHFNKNIDAIIAVASKEDKPIFWASWGVKIELRSYLFRSLEVLSTKIDELGGSWVHFGGLTMDGHPRHPSRLSYEWEFENFDIHQYVQDMQGIA